MNYLTVTIQKVFLVFYGVKLLNLNRLKITVNYFHEKRCEYKILKHNENKEDLG